MLKEDRAFRLIRSTGSISRGSFQIYFSPKPLKIQLPNLDSRCRDFTLRGLWIKIWQFSQRITIFDSITRIHSFRPTVTIFKILKEAKQSAPNASSRNGWIFWYNKSRLIYPSIYFYRFPIYHSLTFSKILIDKHLSDYYPNHSMLHSLATQNSQPHCNAWIVTKI